MREQFSFKTAVAPSEVLFLFALWLQWLSFVLAPELDTKDSLHLGKDCLVRNGLALLIFSHNLRLLTNLGCKILLRHFLGLSS